MVPPTRCVDLSSLSIRADFEVAGRVAGSELADLAIGQAPGVYTVDLAAPLAPSLEAHLFVEVADQQGNVTRVDRRFTTVDPATLLLIDGWESGDNSAWTTVVH